MSIAKRREQECSRRRANATPSCCARARSLLVLVGEDFFTTLSSGHSLLGGWSALLVTSCAVLWKTYLLLLSRLGRCELLRFLVALNLVAHGIEFLFFVVIFGCKTRSCTFYFELASVDDTSRGITYGPGPNCGLTVPCETLLASANIDGATTMTGTRSTHITPLWTAQTS